MFPTGLHDLTIEDLNKIAVKVREPFSEASCRMKIENDLEQDLTRIYLPLAATLQCASRKQPGTLLVGINGAQGSGKSTICQFLEAILAAGFGLRCATLSIDDLYLTRTERQDLAKSVHPLFSTRGVPGTHDINFGLKLINALRELKQGEQRDLPVFDKAIDDRLPESQWRTVIGPVDIILFEGWCVGAYPQPEDELTLPVNDLERDEDRDQAWRRYVNRQLQGCYKELFSKLDLLLMLKIPGMESVAEWRGLQEKKLAATAKTGRHKIMDAAALKRFIMHYERLTCFMLAEMPSRADLVLELNNAHRVAAVHVNPGLLTARGNQ